MYSGNTYFPLDFETVYVSLCNASFVIYVSYELEVQLYFENVLAQND